MPRFLPALRSTAAQAMERKSAVPIAFSRYYQDLAAMNLHRRAKSWPIERAVTEGYERVIWVFKSVNTIATDSARLPYRLRENGQEVDDHPLYDVLNKKANPLESGQVFRKRLSSQIMLSKVGAFVEITKSNGGSVKRVDLLPPDRVEIIPGTGKDLVSCFRLWRRNGTYRDIPPERVRWFRDPHPTDPYSGVTPLEAAGMSVELDHFARLYNVAFLQNDGRPGGILAVRKTNNAESGDISPEAMDRIEDKFGKGPQEAGKLSVIAGDLSYVDIGAKPRDMQYGALSKNSKIETLSAFGMPETVLGYSAERTYSNAGDELYNYWTRTMPAHNEIIVAGFDEDSEDNLEGFLDTSSVAVLEREQRAIREEARTEVAAGLRSIISYARVADIEDEIEDTPMTRALFIPQGRTPIPAKEEDAEALGLGSAPEAAPAPPPEQPALPAGQEDDGIDQSMLPGGASAGDVESSTNPITDRATAPSPGGAGQAALTASGSKSARPALQAIEGGRPKVRAGYSLQTKRSAPTHSTSPSLEAADDLESALAASLIALSERWSERAIKRIESPRQRKHTRHWEPEYENDTRIGTKALDAAKAVDEETWQAEAEEQTHPVIEAAAIAAAILLLTDLDIVPPPGVDTATLAARAVAKTVTEVVTFIGRSAARQAAVLVRLVNEADQRGDSIEEIKAEVRDVAGRLRSWARGLSTQAATATSNGARDDAAREAVRESAEPTGTRRATGTGSRPSSDPTAPATEDTEDVVQPRIEIDRQWVSRRDDKVRHTHARGTGADGQVRGLDEPFIVGDSLLRYPGDPLAPIKETANCRCFLRHRSRRSGRFVAKPARAGT